MRRYRSSSSSRTPPGNFHPKPSVAGFLPAKNHSYSYSYYQKTTIQTTTRTVKNSCSVVGRPRPRPLLPRETPFARFSTRKKRTTTTMISIATPSADGADAEEDEEDDDSDDDEDGEKLVLGRWSSSSSSSSSSGNTFRALLDAKETDDDDDDFDRDAERRRCRRRGGRREDAMVVVLPLVATRIFTSSINRVSLCVRFGFRSREREREVLSRVKVVTTKRIASKGLLLCSL